MWNNRTSNWGIAIKRVAFLSIMAILFASCNNQSASKAVIANIQQEVNDPTFGMGLVVKVNYRIAGQLSNSYSCVVAFLDAEGNPLMDNNNSFSSSDGVVSTFGEFHPESSEGSVSVFLPYNELDIPLNHPLSLQAVAVIANNMMEEIARTETVSFTIK